jgi:hypothetical protein
MTNIFDGISTTLIATFSFGVGIGKIAVGIVILITGGREDDDPPLVWMYRGMILILLSRILTIISQ